MKIVFGLNSVRKNTFLPFFFDCGSDFIIKKKKIHYLINKFSSLVGISHGFSTEHTYLKVLTTNKMKVNKRKVGALRGTFSCPFSLSLSLFFPSLTNHKSHSVIYIPSSTVGFLSLT